MADLTFHRAGAGDAAAVRALTRAAYAKWCALIGREPKPMTVDYDRAVREHMIDLLIDSAGPRLVGLIEMVPKPDHLLVENVAVAPDAQGRGLGHRLMRHAERTTAALSLPQVRLYTNKAFEPNLRFYIGLGYRIDREEPFRGGFIVHFSKPVEPPGA